MFACDLVDAVWNSLMITCPDCLRGLLIAFIAAWICGIWENYDCLSTASRSAVNSPVNTLYFFSQMITRFIYCGVVYRCIDLVIYPGVVRIYCYGCCVTCFVCCRVHALSFAVLICISTFAVHREGRMYASIFSDSSVVCGNSWSIFSRFDWCLICAVLTIVAFAGHSCSGCFVDRDCILVTVWSTLVWSRILGSYRFV